MKFLKKIQKLPLEARKIILWTIVIILGIGLTFIWTKHLTKKLRNLRADEFKEQFKLPPLKEKIEEALPEMEAPKELLDLQIPGLETEQ